MGSVDHAREPCPHRILDDLGGAFGMGAVGGGLWYFGKGAYNAPKGLPNRLTGGLTARARHAAGVPARTTRRPDGAGQAMRFEAPRLGGSFAVWGGLFSAFDCTLVAVRKKASARARARRRGAAPRRARPPPAPPPAPFPASHSLPPAAPCLLCVAGRPVE